MIPLLSTTSERARSALMLSNTAPPRLRKKSIVTSMGDLRFNLCNVGLYSGTVNPNRATSELFCTLALKSPANTIGWPVVSPTIDNNSKNSSAIFIEYSLLFRLCSEAAMNLQPSFLSRSTTTHILFLICFSCEPLNPPFSHSFHLSSSLKQSFKGVCNSPGSASNFLLSKMTQL